MKTNKIRERIAALEAQLREAEEGEREARKAKVARAAERAGLLKIELPPELLEAEFRDLARRFSVPGTTSTGAGDAQ